MFKLGLTYFTFLCFREKLNSIKDYNLVAECLKNRFIMLGRFKSVLYNAIGNPEEEGGIPSSQTYSQPRLKYPYQRPAFLKLATADEIQVKYRSS